MEYYHLTESSNNVKTGPIAVSTTSSYSCPDSCAFKGKGCYAGYGNLLRHWTKVSKGERGGDWNHFLEQLETLPRGVAFRHNQAGDLPGENEYIDEKKLDELCGVIKKRQLKAFSYTHKPLNKENVKKIKKAISSGFVINASTENFRDADRARAMGLPVVTVVAEDAPDKQFTPAGNKVITCPAQTGKVRNCSHCLLCQKSRGAIIAFKIHGNGKKIAIKALNK